ncbi:MAG: C69 family dipeptidase [Bacillota bacterium]|jgi:secernin|nr:C69 family dipeptidase [Bacillota bacterium]HHU43021.1 peptidase U34 [Clostridiales bacterium]
MCDTIVALPNSTKDGRLLFAKNSDRAANEPLLTVRFPAKDYKKGSEVKLTYITMPQAEHTYEVTLMKPSWIWGAEMGFNQFGLNIGNEAVFTKEKRGKPSLIGMDMVRLALERCKTAFEAMEYIIWLLQEYGQGGNCGYDHEFHYHNSFLIADRKEAYVLETAGKFYAVKKVKDIYAISNGLSIGSDYDIIHPEAISYAIKKKRINMMEEFDFAKCFSDKLYTFFAKSKQRRCLATEILNKNKKNITIKTMMDVLRTHAPDYKEDTNSVGSVCMHAGGLIGDHTTGSYVASLGLNDEYYYVTLSSMPCMSVFKPLILSDKMPIPHEDEDKAKEIWLREERLKRFLIAGQIDKQAYLKDIQELEESYLEKFEKANNEQKLKIIDEIWEKATELREKYLKPLEDKDFDFQKGKLSYRRYWTKKTKVLYS